MFYSKDILVRKDSNFGLIWLIATMGSSRPGINKISKKEINRVDILKTCKDISQPPEPLALRFSSNLMVGVARVFGQQYHFYYNDVNSVWVKLKRDLALVNLGDIDMANPEARMDTITFDYDMTVEHQFHHTMNLTQDIEIQVARNNKSRSLAVEFGWATKTSQQIKDTYSDNALSPQEFTHRINDEKRRLITLDESLTSDQSLEFGDRFNFNVMDDELVGEDLGLYIDSDGNLVDYIPALRIGDSENLSLVPQAPANLELLRKHNGDKELNIIVEGDSNEHPALNLDVTPTLPRYLSNDMKKAKYSRLIIDDPAVLPDEVNIESWESYHFSQTTIIQERQLKRAAILVKALIEKSVSHPLCIPSSHPILDGFWMNASARALTNLGDNGEPVSFNRDVEYEFLNEMEQNSELYFDPPEPEQVRRRHMSADTVVTPVELGGGGVFGIGGIEDNRQDSHMPWSINLRTNFSGQSEHSAISSDHLRRDFEAAFNNELGRMAQRQRALIGTDFEMQSFEDLDDDSSAGRQRVWRGNSRSRAGSRDSSRQGFISQGENFGSSSASGYDSEMEFNVSNSVHNPNREHPVIERETVNFLEYVRSIVREANSNSFWFEDVVSLHRRRDVAASAFYHILSLSTLGKMRPTQLQPYQDIQVELL